MEQCDEFENLIVGLRVTNFTNEIHFFIAYYYHARRVTDVIVLCVLNTVFTVGAMLDTMLEFKAWK